VVQGYSHQCAVLGPGSSKSSSKLASGINVPAPAHLQAANFAFRRCAESRRSRQPLLGTIGHSQVIERGHRARLFRENRLRSPHNTSRRDLEGLINNECLFCSTQKRKGVMTYRDSAACAHRQSCGSDSARNTVGLQVVCVLREAPQNPI